MRAARLTAPLAAMRRVRLTVPAVALTCALTGAHLAVQAHNEDRLRTANLLALGGHLAAAARLAHSIDTAPTASAAGRTEGDAELLSGRFALAAAALRRSLARAPNAWTARRDLAVALLALGRRGSARREMARALALNPLLVLPPGFTRR